MKCNFLLLFLQDGLYTSLNDSDEQAIRRKIGIYYKLFTKSTQDDTVHFSVPYIGSQGLGKEHIRIGLI